MSNQKLLGTLEAGFTGYEKNKRAQLLELLSDNFTFEMSDSLPYGGSYIGRDEFVGLWKAVAKEWTYFRYDAHEIIDAGDTIIVPVKTDPLSIRGIRLQNEHLFLFKVKQGRPVFARLYADTAGGIVGAGGEIAWPRPTRPGDELQVVSEVTEVTPSRTKPDRGVVVMRSKTRNQRGEVVQVLTAKLVVPRKPQASASPSNSTP